MSDAAEVVGTVCVAPRARSANRRVYFLELQGDDETRHHVLCKATKLGGLLPDETTVKHTHTTQAPRLCTRDIYHARPCTHHTHAMHMREMRRWRCIGTCGRATCSLSAWGGVSCAPLS